MFAGLLVAFAPAGAQTPAQGPDALTEVYRDWTVRCATPEGGSRRCWMVQTLNRTGSGERILQFELALPSGAPTMLLLTPFGLLLPSGLTVAIDDAAPRILQFRTCVPQGCLIEQKLADTELASLRRGQKMSVAMVAAQNEAEVRLEVSLAGFSAAYTRLTALAGS
ncbi:invasion associated locus B family protein [Acuticoccus kandeliae]|uniref:invasion associated locus B family protein n=1 Tax=Acuticoccus kandeliae TaxID=2073160 RepID=UPI001472E0CD|nr:invasion associated locus B family protein [Acuticoccus kandeliae]